MPDAKTIDVTTEAINRRVAVLREDYAADGAGFDANLLEALAADRDRIAAENAVLREALDPFARAARVIDGAPASKVSGDDGARDWLPRVWPTISDLRAANIALGGS